MMMLLRLWALLMLFAFQAQAETVRVQSGEHADFSRLVLELPTARDWTLGRTRAGYELVLSGAALQFDVSAVFDLIPKDRLTGIFVDPDSGNLQLTVGCACHALPYSLNDRTLVIDLRDGTAPEGSSFESALDGTVFPALQSKRESAPRPRPRAQAIAEKPQRFDWMMVEVAPVPPAVSFPIPELADSETGLRETLVAQLADGAARNVINLALPAGQAARADAPFLSDTAPIRVTSSLGLQIGDERTEAAEMQADGQECLPDEALSIETWMPEDAAAAPYSGLFNALVGEFDKPQKAAVMVAAQRTIYLGFGAEARAILEEFAPDDPDTAVLTALSYLVDGEPIPFGNVFAGMETCDTTAAFWAVLADPSAKTALGEAALKRAFSALPLHLRTHLGPQMVRILTDQGEVDIAMEIGQTVDRGGAEDTRALALARSGALLAAGDTAGALAQVEEVMTDPGQLQAQAVITLVDAQIAAGEPVAADVAETIAAMLEEHEGHALHAALLRTYGLALIGSGQFDAARDFATEGQPLSPTFWTLLAQNADDDTLLVLAMQPPANPDGIPSEAGAQIAQRLSQLGFPAEAAVWQGLYAAPDAVMEASARDAAIADEAVTETSGVPLATSVARWNEDWAQVAAIEDGTWGQLAGSIAETSPSEDAPSLAAASDALSQSQETRALISSLLAETQKTPSTP